MKEQQTKFLKTESELSAKKKFLLELAGLLEKHGVEFSSGIAGGIDVELDCGGIWMRLPFRYEFITPEDLRKISNECK